MLAAVAMATGSATTFANAAEAPQKVLPRYGSAYIVQMADLPAVANEATRPAAGQKIDPNSAAVISYVARLRASHNAALARVGAGQALHHYGYVVNGFAAELTAEQAEKLAKVPGVTSVRRDEIAQLDTATTPAFLGLSGAGGFWQTTGFKGEGVVIGIVDSGVWPEHPSFDGAGFGPLARWNGACIAGASGAPFTCNNKLIGGRFYNAGFGGNAGINSRFPGEFNSPRGFDGHGSHVATTAGGNENVLPTGPTAVLGAISGIAPRARIASYKVCWGNPGVQAGAGCPNSDSVAAIEQAIVDGVDVINFSISGTTTDFMAPVEVAFRNAAAAGVFVAASAGNSGPTARTVAHPSPWITTVAAGTHNRELLATLTLGNGATYSGASASTTALASRPMILSTDAVVAGGNANLANLCYPASGNGGVAVLDPAKVNGKIVVCDRGVIDRVAKSLAVLEAGGVGMVLLNPTASTLNPDAHSVPTVHLQNTARAAVQAYAAAPLPTGAISASTVSLTAAAPFTASFSSRGASLAANGDLLKPDIMAPGQDILAGLAPPTNNGALFGLLSGTSMSSPHIAGIAALFKQAYPTWSPMAIKSALMTTAGDVLDGPNTSPAVVLAQGAGHVRPTAALNPGLVFDSSPLEWQGFLCGQGVLNLPLCSAYSMDASDLNLASISIGDMPGVQTVKRRMTNVSGVSSTYTASYTGLPGYDVVVNPPSLTLGPGQTGLFTVTFTRTSAATGVVGAGQLRWTSGATVVRVPMTITSTTASITAPPSVAGSGALTAYKLNVGYTGPFSATARGLVPATTSTGIASTNSSQTFPVTIPAGTTYARFSLFNADSTPGSDIDLIVRNPGGATVGTGFNGDTNEEVNLVNPAAGVYTVEVAGFAVAGTSPFRLFSWVLGSTSAGNMAVYAPPSVIAGQQATVSIIPSPFLLTPGVRYLGSVVYGGGPVMPAPTIVRIDR